MGGGGCCNRTLDTSGSLERCIRLVQTASTFLERERERDKEKRGRERKSDRKEGRD